MPDIPVSHRILDLGSRMRSHSASVSDYLHFIYLYSFSKDSALKIQRFYCHSYTSIFCAMYRNTMFPWCLVCSVKDKGQEQQLEEFN